MILRPGTYLTVRTGGFVGKVIRLATRSRYNHAAIYLGDGRIVEARTTGATVSTLTYTCRADNAPEPLTDTERGLIVAKALALVGTGYGFLDIAALGLATLGLRFRWLERRVARQDRLICSQLVAVCYAAAGVHLSDEPAQSITPGDLADRLTRRVWEH